MDNSMNNDTNNSMSNTTNNSTSGSAGGYELPKDLKVADFLLSEKGTIFLNVVLYVLAWVPFLLMMGISQIDTNSFDENNPLTMLVVVPMILAWVWCMISAALCTICGWRVLQRIQPTMFLWMNWIGWIIYFFVKVCIAGFIGLFVGPHYAAIWLHNRIDDWVVKRCKEIMRSREG